jgi:hypothetical protein
LHGDSNGITFTKGDKTIVFDIVIPTPKGAVFTMYFKPNNKAELANPSVTESGQSLSIQQAHIKYAHANEEDTRKMAKRSMYLGEGQTE